MFRDAMCEAMALRGFAPKTGSVYLSWVRLKTTELYTHLAENYVNQMRSPLNRLRGQKAPSRS